MYENLISQTLILIMGLSQIIFACIGIYHLIKYIDRLFGDNSDNPVKEQVIAKKEIQYLVNDKEICVPHHLYYLQLLGLYSFKYINDYSIREASRRLLEVIKENNYILPFADAKDVKAAKLFLLDHREHMVMLN